MSSEPEQLQAAVVSGSDQITHIDRNLDTLQFINVAINPSNPAEVQGGTQQRTRSNNDPVGDRNNWPQNIYGDGGNSGYDARFHVAVQPVHGWVQRLAL